MEPHKMLSIIYIDLIHRICFFISRLMRINIDDQDKQKICIFWTILIVFILLIAILSAFASKFV